MKLINVYKISYKIQYVENTLNKWTKVNYSWLFSYKYFLQNQYKKKS